MAQRNASTASFQGLLGLPASARAPALDLVLAFAMCTTGYDRLPHVSGLDLCLDCLRPACTASSLLGRSNPPPVPISPSPIQSSQHPKRPETLFLDNTTLPARTLDYTPLQSLRPNLQSSTPPPGLVSSRKQVVFPNLFPLPVAVSLSVVGSEPIVAPQTDLSRDIRTPAGAPQTFGPSIITPARLAFSPPTTKYSSTTSSLSACRHSLAVLDSTCRLYSSDPIVHSCSPRQSIACPSATPRPTLLFVSFCKSAIRQC